MKLSLGVLSMIATSALAAPQRGGGAAILRDLEHLSTLGTVLYVAAHPDDENTRLLATFANETGLRTAYLSFTRGEGGQNLIGPELGPLLGMIRTQELLAARRLDGAEQFFTRARDFGYSKSVDETLQLWDHDRVLADAVWVIRSLRPDVIITRFPLENAQTHGHHVASARLALEAFSAAADPKFHPEQLEHLQPWQATRIFWNAWSPDPSFKPPPDVIHFNSSPYSPLLGMSYGELAAESRSMHKSQGFGAAPVHGPSEENFALLAGTPAKSLFEGIELGWKRVPGAEKLAALLKQAMAEFKVEQPQLSIPALLAALEELRRLPNNPWKARKLEAMTQVIADCVGLFVEAASTDFAVTRGAGVEVTLTALNRSAAAIELKDVQLTGGAAFPGKPLEAGKTWTQKATLAVPVDAPLSNPYWLDAPPEKGVWNVTRPDLTGLPELPPPFVAEFRFSASGHSFSLTRPVAFKWVDPTVGERFRPLEVLERLAVKPAMDLLVFTDGKPRELPVRLCANADALEGQLKLELPTGWSAEPAAAPFTLAKKGDELELKFKVKGAAAGSGVARAVAQIGPDSFSRGLVRIEHPHIPVQTRLPEAEVKLVRFELARGKTRIGYVEGAGDDVAAALRQAGYEVTVLGDEALRAGRLDVYDAIVIGIRAYNTNPRLPAYQPRLMQYVADGGTVIAQYNTKNWLSSVPVQLGPWPFEITQDRVTDETAEVTFATPLHKVLTTPNKLQPADFEGWVQERGLYFAGKWDPRYQTPLSMHDPGEKPLEGSLLIAKSGKGAFIYTGLGFFRQLPAGVPGAYRLFANLLAYGH